MPAVEHGARQVRRIESQAREPRVEAALDWLAEHFEEQPTLADAAAHVGLSTYHFQRLFARWVGLSPKQFVQVLSIERAKRSLEASRSVLDAALDAGLSGPGRLHDLFVSMEALSPGEFKRRGAGLDVAYGYHDSPFGECLLMRTERGVCGLGFVGTEGRAATLARLSRGWERANLIEDAGRTRGLVERAFALSDRAPESATAPLRLLVRGSAFQVKVWRALLEVPAAGLASYADIARLVGQPGAARAVGTAVGANPVAWLIPCHRVVRARGGLGGYRWGRGRKLAMLSREASAAG